MSLDDDIAQALEETPNQPRSVFAGTVSALTPLSVTLDGSGVAVPCLNFSGVTLAVGRRVGVIKVGSDLVIMGSFGSDIVHSEPVTIDDNLTVNGTLSVVGATTLRSLQWGSTPAISKAAGASSNTTATSTSFATTGIGTTFVAPPSGRVSVKFGGRVYILAANGSACISPYVRTGGTLDSGSDHATPSDTYGVELGGVTAIGDFITAGNSRLIEGLTAGNTYNVVVYHKANPSSSGGSTKVTVSVIPVL